MLGGKKSPQKATPGVETIIGKDATIDGTLTVPTGLRVDGHVTGQIESSGHLVIGESGLVEARVKAATCTIAGRMEGDIEVTGRLEILSTGTLVGDATVGTIVIEEGARFRGTCHMVAETGGDSRTIDQVVDTGCETETE